MLNLFTFLTSATGTTTAGSGTQNEFTPIDWGALWNAILNWCKTTGIRLIIAIIILIVSFKLINFICKKIAKKLEKKKVDLTISKVSVSFLRIVLKVLIIVLIVGYVGFETASLSAVILSLGTGISLAVQGTLSNFAGGVIIVIMRPFKIGDFITSNGQSGTVEDIKLFYTHIVTPDNKAIMIPNGSLANNVIVNVSAKEDRRCDLVMPVAYGTDTEFALTVIRGVIAKNEKVFNTPEPFVKVGELADSSIDIYVRVWCKNSDYWDVYFSLLNNIKDAFEENHIEIPFNQLDVNLKNAE